MKHEEIFNIRDPLYGFIPITEFEKKIIDTWPFQRLRNIHQLGTTMWVYPAGRHTRFEHSLGTFYLSKRMVNCLESELLLEDDMSVFHLASLLHDIGHAPFSHVGENIGFSNPSKSKIASHEVFGARIIRETEINDLIIDQFDKKIRDRIIFVMEGDTKGGTQKDLISKELLTGQVGVDRLDYLRRDSISLGVNYGKFDLERILETVRLDKSSRVDGQEGPSPLYWEKGGIRALEHFVLARYYMYTEVYFHKTTRILNYHLANAILDYLKTKMNLDSFPLDIDEYLELCDIDILLWLKKSKHKPYFYDRKFYKCIPIFENIYNGLRKIRPTRGEKEKFDEEWDRIDSYLNAKYSGRCFIDKPNRSTYQYKGGKFIRVELGETKEILHKVTEVIASLEEIKTRRLYAEESIKDTIELDFVKYFEKNIKS